MLPSIENSCHIQMDEMPYRLPCRSQTRISNDVANKNLNDVKQRGYFFSERIQSSLDSKSYLVEDKKHNFSSREFHTQLSHTLYFNSPEEMNIKELSHTKTSKCPKPTPRGLIEKDLITVEEKAIWIKDMKMWINENSPTVEYLKLSKIATIYDTRRINPSIKNQKKRIPEETKDCQRFLKHFSLRVKFKQHKQLQEDVLKEDNNKSYDYKTINNGFDDYLDIKKTLDADKRLLKVKTTPGLTKDSMKEEIIQKCKEETLIKENLDGINDLSDPRLYRVNQRKIKEVDQFILHETHKELTINADHNDTLSMPEYNKKLSITEEAFIHETISFSKSSNETTDLTNSLNGNFNLIHPESNQAENESHISVTHNIMNALPDLPTEVLEISSDLNNNIDEIDELVSACEFDSDNETKPEETIVSDNKHQNNININGAELPPLPILIDDESNFDSRDEESKQILEDKRNKMAPLLKKEIRKWGQKRTDLTYAYELKRDLLAEERKSKMKNVTKMRDKSGQNKKPLIPNAPQFESYGFLSRYCILKKENVVLYRSTFDVCDDNQKQWLFESELLMALKGVNPCLNNQDLLYLNTIMKTCNYDLRYGADFKLFSVLAALSVQITTLDSWIKNLLGDADFKVLEKKTYFCRKLWEVCVDPATNTIPINRLAVELKAGGVSEKHIKDVINRIGWMRELNLLDFFIYIPLFILMHSSIIENPLDMSEKL